MYQVRMYLCAESRLTFVAKGSHADVEAAKHAFQAESEKLVEPLIKWGRRG